jgi:hypothetical protein
MNDIVVSTVIPGLVLGISISKALRFSHRDGRDRPGHDVRGIRCGLIEGRAR